MTITTTYTKNLTDPSGLTTPDVSSIGLVGACGNLFGGFGVFAQAELCILGDFEDLSLQATGEAATGVGMTFSGGAGALLSNADDSDSLLGWSACAGVSAELGGAGAAGEVCFSLTSSLAGAKPTGVWSLFVGGSFGAGTEGHIGLAHTVEVFNAADAVCEAIAGPVGAWILC